MMKYKYYKGNKIFNGVSFSVLDKNFKTILPVEEKAACFSSLTYKKFPSYYKYISYNIPLSECPYEEDFVIKYTELINNLGFPFEYKGIVDKKYNFIISVDKLNNKRIMLTSTLIIIRYLHEWLLNLIPERWFFLMEKGDDPFIALQKAHNADLRQEKEYSGNWNHALLPTDVTHKKFFTQKEFFKKVDNSLITLSNHSQIETITFWTK